MLFMSQASRFSVCFLLKFDVLYCCSLVNNRVVGLCFYDLKSVANSCSDVHVVCLAWASMYSLVELGCITGTHSVHRRKD